MGEYSGAAAGIGWDLAQGYLFSPVKVVGSKGTGTLKWAHMPASLQSYLRGAAVPPPNANEQYTMLSFRVGGAVSRSLASTTVEDIYVSGGLEVRGGTSEIYRGYSTLPRREEEAGESRTSVHGRE